MFFDHDPPVPKTRDEFPSFNGVVNVSNCWCYLSLLERFVDITRALPQDLLKIYLVRAEYRYFKWMFTNVKDRKVEFSIPPVDVAFFWQAHMLSPLRFQEDTMRLAPFTSIKIPLKEIHEMHKRNYSIVLENWGRIMTNEPYHLTKKVLLEEDGCATVTCIVCNSRIQSSWKDYTEWRTDYSVALQCHCCFTMFTVKHVGKANLLQDNVKSFKIAGLVLNENGIPFKKNISKVLLSPNKDIKSLPFNEGLKPLEKYFDKKLKINTPDTTALKKKVIDAIQSTYLCTPYRGSSIDLIQAVARQYKFAVKATKLINWDIPQGIIRGIRNYSSFLAIIRENQGLTAVPTYEIDLAWHTHMLHHSNYRIFSVGFVGKIINHDDTIPEKELETFVKNTNTAWDKRNETKRVANAPPIVQESKPEIVEEKKKKSFKSKLKSFLSADTISVNNNNKSVRKHGYVDEETLFMEKYVKGTYITSPPYKPSGQSENNNIVVDNDANNISFHDKRDIHEFVKLNNSDKLMDQKFKDVKKSGHGFIGTSTCGNTDSLNQWTNKGNNDDDTAAKNNDIPEDSGYTKDGEKPTFNFKSTSIRVTHKRYQTFNENEKIRYDTRGDAFNWYIVSLAWADTYNIPCDNNKSSCGGWGNTPDTGGAACNNVSSCGSIRMSSSCVGGSSSCGGGSSSCGGGSSSCGSSCGGGGCGGG